MPPRFWTSHKFGALIFYFLLILHPLPGAISRVENPFGFNVSPTEWGVSDTWVSDRLPLLARGF